MHPAAPLPEIPVPLRRRRLRVQRVLCLGILSFLAVPLFLVGTGPLSPVDAEAPVAVRSVEGEPSRRAADTVPDEPITALAAVRQTVPPSTVPSTTIPATTSTAPPTTAAPATTAPPTTVVPATTSTTAPPTTAVPTTAAPAPTTTAPRPAPAIAAPPATVAPPATTTTTAPKPTRNTQRGQATWYRWKPGNCAHNTLPKGTVVTVTAVASGRQTFCVVGDRGAFRSPTIIDLDATVFAQIAPLGAGRIEVSISW